MTSEQDGYLVRAFVYVCACVCARAFFYTFDSGRKSNLENIAAFHEYIKTIENQNLDKYDFLIKLYDKAEIIYSKN